MKNELTLCHKENCINATGKNADIITFAVALMLILIGLSSVARVMNK